jgi:hypothetical protein
MGVASKSALILEYFINPPWSRLVMVGMPWFLTGLSGWPAEAFVELCALKSVAWILEQF